MRQITSDSVNAFMNDSEFHKSNMSVTIEHNPAVGRVVYLRLHGNKIARKLFGVPPIEVSNAGWFSNTTKERLNGLPGVSVHQKDYVWYLNGNEWDGSWTVI